MYISEGHFLSPYIIVLKDGEPVGRLLSVDTELKIANRLVGFDQVSGAPITDFVKIDQVKFLTDQMPETLKDLLPADLVS